MSDGESTRSLIIGAFALTGREELTAAQLIALAKPCGVTATNLKSHLTRMVADGSLCRDERPRASTYQPSERRRRVMASIRARLRLSEQRWDGRWLLLLPVLPAERAERERMCRSLEFDGFRRWQRDTFMRPAWPSPWAMERVAAHARRTSGIRWHGSLVAGEDLVRLLRLYDLDALHRRARRLAQKVERETARAASPSEAWARLIALGGTVVRMLSEDPLLPPELWGERTGVRELVGAYRRFERAVAPQSEAFVRGTLCEEPASLLRQAHPAREAVHA